MHKRDRQLIDNVKTVSEHALQRYCESINAPVTTDPKLLQSISEYLLKLLHKSNYVEDAEGNRHIAISHSAKFVFYDKILITYIVCNTDRKQNLQESFLQRNRRRTQDTKDRKKRARRNHHKP